MLWINGYFNCQILFLGINRGKETIFSPGQEKLLLLAGLFIFGPWQRGLRDREDGTHGRLQSFKWGFGGCHANDYNSFPAGGLQ